jgi:hypothetical protein
LKQNHFNDPDCGALMRAKERLSKQDKQGLDAQSLYFQMLSLDF